MVSELASRQNVFGLMSKNPKAVPFCICLFLAAGTAQVAVVAGPAVPAKNSLRQNSSVAARKYQPKLAQNNAGMFPPSRTEALLKSGRNMLDRAQWDAAYDLFKKYSDIKPIDPEGYFWQGVALDEAGRWDDAISAYKTGIAKAESLDLDSAELWTNLGNAHLKNKQLEESEDAYRKAIEINPHLVPARLNLARVLIEKNECLGALDSLNRCADLHFNGPQLPYYRAKAFVKLGRSEEALVHVDKLLTQLPESEQRARARQEFASLLPRTNKTP